MDEQRKYFMRNRPPCFGCQPDGQVESEVWQPARPAGFPENDLVALGFVVYERKLTRKEVWKFELMPADLVERVASTLWEHWWEPESKLIRLTFASYFDLDDEALAEIAAYDSDGRYVQKVKELGVTKEAVLAEWEAYPEGSR